LQTRPQREQLKPESKSPLAYQEENLIRLLLLYGNQSFEYRYRDSENDAESVIDVNVASFIVEQLEDDNLGFKDPIYQQIYEKYKQGVSEDAIPSDQFFIQHSDDKLVAVVADLLSTPHSLSENWKNQKIHVITEEELLLQAVNNSVLSFKQRKLEHEIHELQNELKEAPENEKEKLLMLILKKQNIQRLIAERLGRIVLK